MRVRARTDANHVAIGRLLRQLFPAVEDCRQHGGGMSDYLVLTRAGLRLVEVKDGSKPPSERRLTPPQEAWKAKFGSYYVVVTCEGDVLELYAATRAA